MPGSQRGHAPGIVLRGASKRYGSLDALGSIDLEVAPGELLAVVGPSGCGKTTLLRVIAGLEKASHGSVDVGPAAVGCVFQDAALLPWRTVLGNVELLGELEGVPTAARRQAATAALATVGLAGSEHVYPRALSGGMRMRASLARALTTEPEVFLFDEPFGALDEMTRERLNEELGRLFASARFAGVFVTHSVTEAAFVGTRVAVMSSRPGRVVLDRAIPFPHPRPVELRFDPSFTAVCAEISGALRGAS